jgi:hypothetical protein
VIHERRRSFRQHANFPRNHRSLDDWYGASGDQPHVMVLLDGGRERRTGWYFAIGDLEEIL